MSEPLFSCQIEDCAREVSHPADMLALWNGEPICENCYDERRVADDLRWSDLPTFVPDFQAEIERLRRALEVAARYIHPGQRYEDDRMIVQAALKGGEGEE